MRLGDFNISIEIPPCDPVMAGNAMRIYVRRKFTQIQRMTEFVWSFVPSFIVIINTSFVNFSTFVLALSQHY